MVGSIDNSQVGFNKKVIILAGATGALGQRIAHHLLQKGATVKALIRKGAANEKIASLRDQGVIIQEVDFSNHSMLVQACVGGTCVVSALSGLEEVIVGVQSQLLEAAIETRVPRFIPSDFCIDFTKLQPGTNRNLDLRRAFYEHINNASIAATSILNGMFTDLLTGQAPIILFKWKRVVYWGDADQLLDFTTMENTASFTAAAALDSNSPRFLRVAGDVVSSRGIKEAASQATGKPFSLLRAGGLGAFETMIKITRTLLPKNNEVFPPWQGMQYLHNMYSGLPKLDPLDNNRYPNIKWTSVREVLATRAV
jgi:nucleoside-diphosphate-sugar epimerase